MNETPTNYFKLACEESDENIRLRKIIRGCKLITDIFLDETQYVKLLAEKEVIKYIILCYYFHKNSIELILNSLLQIFKDNDQFLNEFWRNLEYIGAIYDGEHNPLDKKSVGNIVMKDEPVNNNEMFLEKYEKLLIKELQDHVQIVSKNEVTKDIQSKLFKIKSLTLDYASDLFNTFVLKEMPREFLESKLTLFKIFLMNTFNEKLIKRLMQILDQIKLNFPGIIKNLTIYEQQITNIINKKNQPEILKSLPYFDTKNAYQNIFANNSPLLPSKNLIKEFSLERKNSASPTKLKMYENRPESEEEKEDDEDEEDKEIEEYKKEYKEKLRIERLTRDMEEWLCIQKEPILSQSDLMSTSFKKIEHLEIFLLFIIDPKTKILEPCWSKYYEEISKRNVPFDASCFKQNKPKKGDAITSRIENLYYLRSFKAVSCITQRINLKYLLTLNENSLTCIFEGIKVALNTPSYQHVNLYHLTTILDSYLLLEPNVSVNHIINNQMIASLLENCHNPEISAILLNLLEPYTSKYDIFGQTQVHLWTHCLDTCFLESLCLLILKEPLDPPNNNNGGVIEDENKNAIRMLERAEKLFSQQKTMLIKMQMVKKLGGISHLFPSGPKEPQLSSLSHIEPSSTNFELKHLDALISPSSETMKLDELQQNKLPDIDNIRGFFVKEHFKSAEFSSESHILSEKPPPVLGKRVERPKAFSEAHIMVTVDKLGATTSSMDMEKGFTSSKLISLYPSRFTYEHVAKLDVILGRQEYKGDKLKEQERMAFPASVLLNGLLSTIIDYEDQRDTVVFLKMKKKEGALALLDIFFHKGGVCFERVFMNYLLKIKLFPKQEEAGNSGVECGKLVNNILRSLCNPKAKTHGIIVRYKPYILRVCQLHFDFLCKILMQQEKQKKEIGGQTQPQPANYEIPVPLIRLMLIETLLFSCQASSEEKVCFVNEVHATLWHVLVLQYFSNRSADIFQHIFIKILELAVKHGSEETLFNVLFKINLLGSLYNAYETFVKNEVADRTLNIDGFLYYLKKIAELINSIPKTKPEYKEVLAYLKASKNWNKLKKELIPIQNQQAISNSVPSQNQINNNTKNVSSTNNNRLSKLPSKSTFEALKEEKKNVSDPRKTISSLKKNSVFTNKHF